jgi:hypothetical protein
VRHIGIDVHSDFCEVCGRDEGGAESRRRIATRPAQLERFAAGLRTDDFRLRATIREFLCARPARWAAGSRIWLCPAVGQRDQGADGV